MGNKRIHPYFLIIISFVITVLIGCALLSLPIASKDFDVSGVKGWAKHIVDSLFMSTSAVCVTGLGVKNVYDYTIFGRVVMAVLMEIGGLSFITIAIFFFTILGARIGFSNTFLLREALNQNTANGMVKLVRKIVVISLMIQLICGAINVLPLYYMYDKDVMKAIGVAAFHSAATFNNAGFDIFNSQSAGGSMVDFKDYTWENAIMNGTTISMILLGGIGFVVIDDVLRHRRWKKFNLHTKVVLVSTLYLMLIGALLIKVTAWKDMNWLQALFASVTCRTAGFTTYDMSRLTDHPATYIVIIVLMFIGASPCSTGGGVKTTTFALILITIYYYARGRKAVVYKRSINSGAMFKAFVLIAMGFGIVLMGTFIIGVLDPELGLEKIMFEVVSAFSTTGLSMGITGSLSYVSRLVVCIIMLFGRLGPLTIIGLVNKNWMANYNEPIGYPEENVIIG